MTIPAQVQGDPDDPVIVLFQRPSTELPPWPDLAHALVRAGRQLVRVNMPPANPALSLAPEQHTEEIIKAVLAQLPARPTIVCSGCDSAAVVNALSEGAENLVTGVILIDPQLRETPVSRTVPDQVPVLLVYSQPGSDPGEHRSVFSTPEVFELLPELNTIGTERSEALSAILIDFLERRLPRAVPEFRLGSDARTLRDALGCFATGVTILTALTPERTPVGLTANSFTSVSLDPPLLLVCIARSASSAEIFCNARNFAVNVLHIGQQPASVRFARKEEDRFGATPWETGLEGTPVLTGSLATFECARNAVHDGGDHFIIVGKVERARFEPRRDPLLYFRGKYRRLHFT